MSDNIPFEMQVEIMKWLPVKSLLRFRSLSKSWKSLIDSSDFVALCYRTQQQHILVSYEEPAWYTDPDGYRDDEVKPTYVSIADDQTFPQHKVSPTVPFFVTMLSRSTIIGSSHGLICLHGVYSKRRWGPPSETNVAVIWNISIRRAIPVVVPNVADGMYDTFIGFGVCRATSDPKIVKITYVNKVQDVEKISSIPYQVEVFTLSTGVWRRPHNNIPRKSIQFLRMWKQVVVDGFLYWGATDRLNTYAGYTSYNLIVSFDITTEEFSEVHLPHSLAQMSVYDLSMSKLRESLVVLHHVPWANNSVIDVWKMEDGDPKLFTMLFTINVNIPTGVNQKPDVRGFRKSGEAIIEILVDDFPTLKLVGYHPNSKRINDLGINGVMCVFSVHPYMETLLLLNQPNLAVYNKMETIEYLDGLVSQAT